MIFDFPLWLSGILLVAGLSSFSLAAQWVVRRRVTPVFRILPHEIEYPATIIASVMVFYGLVAALVAITVWERHMTVHERAAAEASTIATLWRDLGAYPAQEREVLRHILREYTEYVIHKAWPEYRKGRIPYDGVEWLDRFQERLHAFEPTTDGQRALHEETLRAYNQMVNARRLRLDFVGIGLPGIIWFLVIMGGLVGIVVSLLYPLQDARYQGVLVVSLAVFIALVIIVILGLDQPFRGDLGVSPESLELVYDQLMKP